MLKKILIITGILLVVLIVGGGILMVLSSRPLSKEQAVSHFDAYFRKKAKPSSDYSGVQAYVYSETLGMDWQFAQGNSSRADRLTKDQPFHLASVGKLFTATTIYQLAEEGKINLDDPITTVYASEQLDRLFVSGGVDYKDQVTFRQLLSHTSGIADYFEGPVNTGETMAQLLVSQPERVWQPQELLDFSKDFQTAVNAPGESYAYSDSGYILLGLIIEAVESKAYERVLEERFFNPLGMNDSYMATRSAPLSGNIAPIADLWLEGIEFGDAPALSVDWSGGGVISTLDDLLRFSIALHDETLINSTSLDAMFSDTNKFNQGIYTGEGGMTVRFKEFFPLLDLPLVRGHIGILGTHLFYDATTDTHIVLNFGSTSEIEPSFMALIEILSVIKRVQP